MSLFIWRESTRAQNLRVRLLFHNSDGGSTEVWKQNLTCCCRWYHWDSCLLGSDLMTITCKDLTVMQSYSEWIDQSCWTMTYLLGTGRRKEYGHFPIWLFDTVRYFIRAQLLAIVSKQWYYAWNLFVMIWYWSFQDLKELALGRSGRHFGGVGGICGVPCLMRSLVRDLFLSVTCPVNDPHA